jgi:DNA primase
MGTWIDYKKLRESLNVVQVLQHYRVQFKRKGTQVQAKCPLPGHPEESTSLSFSINVEKRVFQCFGCGASGNILDFIARMQGKDPRIVNEFRQSALFAQQTFGAAASSPPPQRPAPPPIRPLVRSVVQSLATPQESPPVLFNEPLDFELKNLDPTPRYLFNRGFSEATIRHFGLGYCTKGTFAGRVVIPLHDTRGRLIGYAGRGIYFLKVDF